MSEIASQADKKQAEGDPTSSETEIAAAAAPEEENKVMSAVDAFLAQFYLSKFSKQIALQYMKKIAADPTDDNERVKKWLMRGMNKVVRAPDNCDDWQRGCPDKIPGIRAQPVWDTKDFDWVERIEENFNVILEELVALEGLDVSGFQPYRAPAANDKIKNKSDGVGVEATDAGSWNVFYLSLGKVRSGEWSGAMSGVERRVEWRDGWSGATGGVERQVEWRDGWSGLTS